MSADTERAVRDEWRLAAVAASGTIGAGPRESLQRLASLASYLLEAPLAFVTAVDDRVSWYLATAGVPDDGPTSGDVDESFCKYVIASDEHLMVGDARLDPLTADNRAIDSLGVIAWAGYPIHTAEGAVLGSFCVVDTEPRHWSERDRRILEALSRSASAEIQLWSRIETERRGRRRAEALQRTAMSLADALTIDSIVSALTDVTLEDFGAELGTLVRRDPHDPAVLRALGGWGYEDRSTIPRWQHFKIEDASPALRDAIISGRPVLIGTRDEAFERWPGIEAPGATPAHQAWAVLPFEVAGVTTGLLILNYRRPRLFDLEDRALLVGLVAQVGQAVARAERFEFERDIAMALQHSLLGPKPVAPPGLELSARYLPGSVGLHVGGDWYDVITIDQRRTLFVIGDVVGHGLRAAAAMGQIRAATRALAPMADPAAILQRLDTFALSDPAADCATVLCAMFDSAERTLSLSLAGHPPPLLRTATGVDVLCGGLAGPLGTCLTARPVVTVSLPAPFTLLFYTDGLVERRGTIITERISELAVAFQNTSGSSADEITDSVLRTMLPNGSALDDVAILCIQDAASPS
jgi:GAF domain-containing protein